MSLPDLLPQPLRRGARRLRRHVVPSKLRLVYHDDYTAAFPETPQDALRAERILAFLASEGLVLRRCVHRPEPVWLKALARVHTAEYLDALRDSDTLTSIMGLEVDRAQVDRMLDYQRLQTGGTLMATRRARSRGIGVNLGGGFHHAHAGHGGGFCIFNDVAVAIADERRKGFDGPVLVVDLDLHDGDGTRDIFRHDPTVHTFSVHARHWGDPEGVETTSLELGDRVEDDVYLEVLRRELPALCRRFRPRLVFYVAGCDPACDDQLGNWRISPEAMLERDRLVAGLARSGLHRVPLVIVLAGGYGQETWRYTARFLADLELGRPLEPPSTEEITLKRYRYIASLFTAAELSGGGDDEFGLTAEDLFLPGWASRKETRLLGFYTRHGLELVLERSGFLDRVRDLGYAHPVLVFQLDDPGGGHTVRLYGEPRQEELLVEARLSRDRRTVEGMELLSVDWLLMQNPRADFGPGREALPGQSHPGLGMLNDVIALLIAACERLHLDGLVFVPSQFHVAAYGKSHLGFVKPEVQALFGALLELFRDTSFGEATRAVAEGRVVDADSGEPVAWRPEAMVLPVSRRLRELLEQRRRAFRDTVDRATPRLRLLPASRGTSSPD